MLLFGYMSTLGHMLRVIRQTMELLEGGKNYEMNPSEICITSGVFLVGMPRIFSIPFFFLLWFL